MPTLNTTQHPSWENAPRVQCSAMDGMRLRGRYFHTGAVAKGSGAGDAVHFVVLHGGPGSSCQRSMCVWFDLVQDNVLMPDQRGAGLSGNLSISRAPKRGAARRNTLSTLIDDLEAWRRQLGIEKWILVGGSWGATLALAYASRHPQNVAGILLRGSFSAKSGDVRRFFSDGSCTTGAKRRLFKLLAISDHASIQQKLISLNKVFQKGSISLRNSVAMAWSDYEAAVVKGERTRAGIPLFSRSSHRRKNVATKRQRQLVQKFSVQAQYLAHQCYLGTGGIRTVLHRLREATFPMVALHGLHDRVCPPATLIALKRELPQLQIHWVPSGHLSISLPMTRALAQGVRCLAEIVNGQDHKEPMRSASIQQIQNSLRDKIDKI